MSLALPAGDQMKTTVTEIQQHARDERLSEGAKRFEEVMGVPASAFIENFNAVAPDFGKYVLEWEFADLYGRPGLDARTREIVVIASCATLGATGVPALQMHIRSALRAGITRAEIAEVLMQLAFSAGLPTAIGALQAARDVFESMD